jgi:AcrR family transcriptional regulator
VALLAEKRFHAISVQDIAERATLNRATLNRATLNRATLNRATFYAHFGDTYALMDYMVGEYIREALQRRLPVGASFTLNNPHMFLVAVCKYLAEFQGHCAPAGRDLDLRIEARVQQEVYTVHVGWLAQAQAAGLPNSAVPASHETAASVMS